MKINIFDNNFSHIPYSVPNQLSQHIEYEREAMSYDGITVFTDNFLFNSIINRVDSKYKIAWLLEPRSITPYIYNNITKVDARFDYVLTHDQTLLQTNPLKYKFCPVGGCWIENRNYKIHSKNKQISMIYSNKSKTGGHKLRHTIANAKHNIDLFGSGTKTKLQNKDDGLKDYMFSVAVENSHVENYFTEKLIDCFAVGTVPIYWGCTNIEKFFDERGLIRFHTSEDLTKILLGLNEQKYKEMLPYIKTNWALVNEYKLTEDWIYKNFFRKLEL